METRRQFISKGGKLVAAGMAAAATPAATSLPPLSMN